MDAGTCVVEKRGVWGRERLQSREKSWEEKAGVWLRILTSVSFNIFERVTLGWIPHGDWLCGTRFVGATLIKGSAFFRREGASLGYLGL